MTQRNRFFIPREDKKLGDRYQLLEQLGDGSYGWVWRAEKLENREIIALKIPKEQGASNDDLAEGSALVNKLGFRGLMISGSVLCAVSLILAALPVSPLFTIFWLSLLGFGVAAMWPTILGTAGDKYPNGGASMYGLLAAAGNFGGVAGPVLVGVVADAGAPHAAMGVLAIAPLVALATVLLNRTR